MVYVINSLSCNFDTTSFNFPNSSMLNAFYFDVANAAVYLLLQLYTRRACLSSQQEIIWCYLLEMRKSINVEMI